MATKRRSLGRGIGSLIPQTQREVKSAAIDIFFQGGSAPANAAEKAADDTTPGVDVSRETKAAPTAAKKSVSGSTTTKKPSTQAAAKDKEPAKSRAATTTTAKEPAASTQQDVMAEGASTSATKKATKSAPKKTKAPAKAAPEVAAKAAEETSVESTDEAPVPTKDGLELVPVPGATFGELDVDSIVPNTRQPREYFDEDELEELSASIAEVGVLQPIVVRPLKEPIAENPKARYELIMGERRWRATQRAGLTVIPAVVRRTEDNDVLRDALLENLHRAQLNPLEEASAYQQLLEDFGCTQEELATRIARSRPQITNMLRLLKLPPLVQKRVAAGVISAGHARALLALPDPAAMERLAQRIVAEGLSVRSVEEIVAMTEASEAPEETPKRGSRKPTQLPSVATSLTDRLDTRVRVTMGSRRGKIAIDFANYDDLARILVLLGIEDFELPE